jgi:undecaprenyl-diphosphatase
MATRKLNHLVRLSIQKFTLVTLLFWSLVAMFVALAGEVLEREPIRLDVWVLETIHAYANPTLDRLMIVITTFGSTLVIIAITLAIMGFLAWRGRWRQLVMFGLIAIGATGMNAILKQIFQRSRPSFWQALVVEKSYSFPSGNAMASSALVFAVIVILWRTKWRWPAIIAGGVYAGLVGLSRLYLGVHFPTDILAAWCVSLAWALIVYRYLQPGTGVSRSLEAVQQKLLRKT